ncbi:unnamed protein product [Auanema sp. JU1783]|nr:unnamed protein product [Auanema sp. JU1783]
MSRDSKSQFVLIVNGQVETARFPTIPDLSVRLFYSYGPDWYLVAGPSDFLSSSCSRGHGTDITIDLPFQGTFSSTNPFKWPQIAVVCYGRDFFGHDIIRGYGATRIPTIPGRHRLTIPCFTPEPSTMLQRIIGYFWGKRPTFLDPAITTKAEGRQAARVSTQGILSLSINVLLKDMKKLGFDVTPATLSKVSEFPLPDFHVTEPSQITHQEHAINAVEPSSQTNEIQDRQLPQLVDEPPT